MRKLTALVLAILMLCALTACGQQKAAAPAVGSWTLTDSAELSDEAQAAFEKGTEGLLGVSYTPIALLGTQLVSGTNYCILCEATVVYPDAKPYYALVYLYKNTQGEVEVRNIVALDLGKIAETGEIENAGEAEALPLGGWTVDRDSSVEVADSVMHLASQVVSGTNHCVLCKGWTLSFVYEDLEGKTELTKTVSLDIAAYSQPSEAE